MKKLWILAVTMILLSGCGMQETFETLGAMEVPVWSAGEIQVQVPRQAEELETGYYLCGDYDLAVQTLAGGDLDRSLILLTGHPAKDLSLVETGTQGLRRYDFVWSAAGERGDQLCRGVLLDDGHFHYAMTAAAEAGERPQWAEVFSSFGVNTGSVPPDKGNGTGQ